MLPENFDYRATALQGISLVSAHLMNICSEIWQVLCIMRMRRILIIGAILIVSLLCIMLLAFEVSNGEFLLVGK